MPRAFLGLVVVPSLLLAAAPPARPPAPFGHGNRLRDDYFRLQATQLGEAALADIRSKEDWAKRAPQMRRQFLDMMGLWPLPPRTDLKATVTGSHDAGAFTVEKLHFQSMPGLYVTANLYLPRKRNGPLPAVLYVCGHGPAVIDGVPHGNKVTYQHHGAWLAENGYACLIVDTLQLGEVPGLHHGTSRFDMWWWVSLGYTPAGVELWNAMRAIDYLESRPEVDPKRLGVTGRSGGGATSWWVGAADERVKCIIPVAGIADLLAHVSEGYPGRLAKGVVAGHCDCMYLVNTYRWDYTQVIALCAPRPVLLGNSDVDDIFPVPGYRRMVGQVERLYDLLGARDRFALLETKGPHKDTTDLRKGAFRWLNRWLKNGKEELSDPERPRIDPRKLKVFTRIPADQINDIAHERFRQPARLDLPEAPEVARAWWAGKAPQLKQALLDRVFRGWPQAPPPLGVKVAADVTHDGVRLRAFDFLSEEAVPLRTWLIQSAKAERPTEVLAAVVDEAGWNAWLADLGPAFRDALHCGGNPAPRPYPAWNEARFKQHREAMRQYGWAFAIVTPRGVGRTAWAETKRGGKRSADPSVLEAHQVRRRYYLLGQTLEGQQVWDVRRAVRALRSAGIDAPLTLQGEGDMAVLALYAALFEPGVAGVELRRPPASHRAGPALLNVLSVLDVPQAVALLALRKARVRVRPEDEASWSWLSHWRRATGDGGVRLDAGTDG